MQDTLRVGKMVGLRVRKRRCQNTTDSAARYRLTPDVAACPKTFTNSEVVRKPLTLRPDQLDYQMHSGQRDCSGCKL